MPNIKPVSDLRNYTEVLRDISVGEPVFLTKNGRGRYAIVDMEEYEKYINRYVRSYHVLGVNKENGRLQMFYVLWNDYNSLKFVEENRDRFLIVSDYTILQ